MEGKEEKKRLRVSSLKDEQDTGIDIVIYTDNTVNLEFRGNAPKMLLCIIRDANKKMETLTNMVQNLSAMAEVNDRIFRGESIDDEFMCGTTEDIIKDIFEEKDTLKKVVMIKAFIDQVNDQDQLLKFLSRLKDSEDFFGKSKMLEYGSEKLKFLVGNGRSRGEC